MSEVNGSPHPQVKYQMIAGGRIDLELSSSGAWLLEVDGRWERCYEFLILPAEGARLTCYGTILPDGLPNPSTYPTHTGLLALVGELENPANPGQGFIAAKREGVDKPTALFSAANFGRPLLYEETGLLRGGVGYLDVRRVVVTCNTEGVNP